MDNIRRDPRCVLLVDDYSDDWSELWWVRVHATAEETQITSAIATCLAGRYEQYERSGALASELLLVPQVMIGWRA